MSWLRIDDNFTEHPKVESVSDRAFRLHVRAMCYAMRFLTDGRLSSSAVDRLKCSSNRARNSAVKELVDAGLWDSQSDGSFVIHDFLSWNPSRQKVEEKRAATRERKERSRKKSRVESRRDTEDGHAVTHGVRHGGSHASPIPSPVYSKGDPKTRQVDPDPPPEERTRPRDPCGEHWANAGAKHDPTVLEAWAAWCRGYYPRSSGDKPISDFRAQMLAERIAQHGPDAVLRVAKRIAKSGQRIEFNAAFGETGFDRLLRDAVPAEPPTPGPDEVQWASLKRKHQDAAPEVIDGFAERAKGHEAALLREMAAARRWAAQFADLDTAALKRLLDEGRDGGDRARKFELFRLMRHSEGLLAAS